ncbi:MULTISPECIES: Na+/H+ antiporter NhaC family protein [Clostridium]|uniref:Malate-2H(+)/Na(+)-lactate antiporter n=4 Tax=Clostridium TaxID=1485 RepID=D8GII5_CLOLD|nr:MULTISPECIES: Na+/H+ antiporter NhaC family protein [Clostridium]ADK17059.1 predicted Na+/H+ antiporter [Clostridium ljungdahlii DSM 13528]AGY76100.1 sodium:proton antiporter [Clostridium autoethanogenum DSM 10061]ALU36262.1 Na(+)/H(+) antiporter NhaC-like protein [Clostridium autoethanogenum DSM 10061]OAA85175.1 Malate-2H(+)/Na(+)-lactate antiporter [Clostridium ljungdahlii DSM 13528]OVY48823.1 Malate-2H(+)/Na(+)-lactate antiporter [Clostridium autoethanogenum]
MEGKKNQNKKREMSVGVAVLIFVLVAGAIAVQKAVFQGDMGSMFFICWLFLIPIGVFFGYDSNELTKSSFNFIQKAIPAIFILLAAGSLIGTWIAAGTTPAVIYYGIKIINPKVFLVTTLLLSSALSMFTGSAYGTMGTVGVAMMGIGSGLNVPPAITAGAVICGAYFGNRLSPMADTTILASTTTGINIFKYIKFALNDQVPAYLITVIFFLVIGFRYGGSIDPGTTREIVTGLQSNFHLGIITLTPLVITGILLAKKQPALIAILSGSVSAIFVSIFYQGVPVARAFNIFYSGYSLETQSKVMQTLLNRGGIDSMWSLAGITLFGFAVAGMLQHMKVLETIAEAMVKRVHTTVGLTFITLLLGFLGNAIALSQNFAIVMTGTLMAPIYKRYNLQVLCCCRDVEAGGTYGALFFPWNSNTVFAASVLGVSAGAFIPYLILLYITPIIIIGYAITNFKMLKIYSDEKYVDVSERLKSDPDPDIII